MWLSKKLSAQGMNETAERGSVIMSSADSIEAQSSALAREVGIYYPYGYSAVIPRGEEILLFPASDGFAAAGTKAAKAEIAEGEVKITSLGGASILLKNDGSVVINGSLVIDREGNIT